MFHQIIQELKYGLSNPYRLINYKDVRLFKNNILQNNYKRLSAALLIIAFFGLTLLMSDLFVSNQLLTNNHFFTYLITDSLLTAVAVVLFSIVHVKKIPTSRFKRNIINIFFFFMALWIGFVAAIGVEKYTYITFITGVFIISGAFLFKPIQHLFFLSSTIFTFLLTAYLNPGFQHDSFSAYFILPVIISFAYIYNLFTLRSKIDSYLKAIQLEKYSSQLEKTVENRTKELQGRNKDLTREIETKEFIHQKLKDSEELFKSILHQSEESIIIIDKRGYIVDLNYKSGVYFDLPMSEAVNKAFLQVVSKQIANNEEKPQFVAQITKYLEQARYGMKPQNNLEVVFSTSFHGEKRHFEMNLSPVVLPKGLLIVALTRDITTRKKYEQALERAKNDAEKTNQLKSDFLANMSHDLRAPLNSISGFGKLLLLKENLTKEKRIKYLDIILNNTSYLLQLINDLIDVSKIQSGNIEIKQEVFTGNAFMDEVDSIVNNDFNKNKKDVVLKKVIKNKGSKIISDKIKLIQIYTNLINNAIKFTEKGTIEYGFDVEDKFLIGYVLDTGKGIAAENLTNIFKRFYQVEDGTQEKKGKGLGLAIVKGYIDLLGGKIDVSSQPNNGTRFDFRIPVRLITDPGSKPAVNLSEDTHVLVVDNDRSASEIIKELLKMQNLHVSSARSIETAQRQIEIIKPDVVMIDLFLDNEFGWDLANILRKAYMDLPLVAFTSMIINDKTKKLCRSFDEIIYKPVDADTLIHKLNKLINESSSTN